MHLNFLFVFFLFFFQFIRYGLVILLVPIMAKEMGATPSLIGLVVGSYSLISIFLPIPLGALTDRLGVKRILIAGVIFSIASGLLLVTAGNLFMLIFSQIIGGVGQPLIIIAGQTFITQVPAVEKREKYFGYMTFSAAFGQTLGPILCGIMLTEFDSLAAAHIVLATSLAGLLVLFWQNTGDRTVARDFSLSNEYKYIADILNDRQMVIVLLFTFIMMFASTLRASFLPVLLKNREISEFTIGILISFFAATSTFIRLFIGMLLSRYTRKILVGVASLAVIVGVIAIPYVHSLFGLGFFIGMFGFGFGLMQPLSIVMTADLADPGRGGLTMGMRFTANTLAGFIGPVLMGIAAERFGLNAAFHLAFGIVVIFTIYIYGFNSDRIPDRKDF